jgi:hypothetical protein
MTVHAMRAITVVVAAVSLVLAAEVSGSGGLHASMAFMASDAARELEDLAKEYVRYGKITLLFFMVFLVGFALLALPALLAAGLPTLPPRGFKDPAVLGALGGLAAAALAVLLVVGFPLFMLVVAAEIRKKTRYSFCRRGAEILAFFHPFGPYLSTKTLLLLNRPDVKRLFNQSL